MFAANEGDEITYYEELGVAPDASQQEIRDAFRLIVRILHPDHQTDPQLREIAEKQMRKLNRVYAVLSDPQKRREYDETLEGAPTPALALSPSPRPDFRRHAAKIPWAAATLLSASVLIWLALDFSPGNQNRPAELNGAPVATAAPAPEAPPNGIPASASNRDTAEIARLRAELKAASAERDDAIQKLDSALASAEKFAAPALTSNGGNWPIETAAPQSAAPLTMTELPPAPKAVAGPTVVAPARTQRTPNRRLAGFWFYAKPAEGQKNKNTSLYLPEYIEATITEDGTGIHGRYRSRFLIADRAITPDVNFTFSGTLNGTQCNCQWTGTGGAKGELTLKLTGDNSMRVDWIASEMGSLGLGSGTAVLTRRIE